MMSYERRWSLKTQNVGKQVKTKMKKNQNSQANKWDRTLGEDSTKVENELRNMRREVDELKSAIKD